MTGVKSPAYVPGHGLLRGRTAVVTAAAGAGIGGADRPPLPGGGRARRHQRRPRPPAQGPRERAGRGVRRGPRAPRCPATSPTRTRCRRCSTPPTTRTAASTSWSTTPASAAPPASSDMTDEQWNRVLDVTLNGTFRCTRAALRRMQRRRRRRRRSSTTPRSIGWRAQEGQAHYAAAKAGVMALTRCAAIEAAAYGVRVNAVSPSLAMHPHLVKVTSRRTAGRADRHARRSGGTPSRGRSPT